MITESAYDYTKATKDLETLFGTLESSDSLFRKMVKANAGLSYLEENTQWGPWEFAHKRGPFNRQMGHGVQSVVFDAAYQSPKIEITHNGKTTAVPEFLQMFFDNKGSANSVAHRYLFRAVPSEDGLHIRKATPQELTHAIAVKAATKVTKAATLKSATWITQLSNIAAINVTPSVETASEAMPVKFSTTPVAMPLDFNQSVPAPHPQEPAKEFTLRPGVSTHGPRTFGTKRAARPRSTSASTKQTGSLFSTKSLS